MKVEDLLESQNNSNLEELKKKYNKIKSSPAYHSKYGKRQAHDLLAKIKKIENEGKTGQVGFDMGRPLVKKEMIKQIKAKYPNFDIIHNDNDKYVAVTNVPVNDIDNVKKEINKIQDDIMHSGKDKYKKILKQ